MAPRLRQAQPDDPTWRLFLTLFNEKRPLSTSELARLVGLPRNTTYYHLERLQEMGLALRDEKLWICQPMFHDKKAMDIITPAYEVLTLLVIEKMFRPEGVSPVRSTAGALAALVHLFEIQYADLNGAEPA